MCVCVWMRGVRGGDWGEDDFSEEQVCVLFQSFVFCFFSFHFVGRLETSPPLCSSTVDELNLERSEAAGPDRIGSGIVRRPRQRVSEIE